MAYQTEKKTSNIIFENIVLNKMICLKGALVAMNEICMINQCTNVLFECFVNDKPLFSCSHQT